MMALSKFVDFLKIQGIKFYTKKTNDGNITDITQFKQRGCFMKEPNCKIISGSDTLVIFTGETNNPNIYLTMVDFDKLDVPHNKQLLNDFTGILESLGIDTYHEKTMRDGYHYFFISNNLYKNYQGLEKNEQHYDVDIRGQGGKSISFGTKFGNMRVKLGNTSACKDFKFAILPQEIINLLKIEIYNPNVEHKSKTIFNKPRKIKEIQDINDEFCNIKPLVFEEETELDTNFKKTRYILQLLSRIDNKYFSSYDEWLSIGFALGTIANEEPQLESEFLKLYLSFSAQYKYWNIENYNMACKIFYSSNNTITLGTLIYKLKKHDAQYKIYQDLITITKFENMVRSPTHGSVASYYHSLFPDKYIYDDNINKWYILLDSNIWELLKDHTRRIRIDVKHNIISIINNKIKNLTNADADKEKNKKYLRVIDKLNTEDFMKNTFYSLKDYYIKYNTKFDQKPSIFAFKNGWCIDLSNDNKIIRKVIPEDYVTLHTGYDYIDPNQDDIKFINTFITQLFEKKEEVDFIINSISNVLYGNNKYQKCFFFLGIGANGKSVLLTLLERAFGNYGMKTSSTLFTKPEKDSLVSPEIVQCKNKRFLHISEPNPDDKIQQSRYKSTTGNESISARSLFSNEIETYIPSYTPFISCNQVPIFEKIDEAIRRRSILVHFKFRFTNKKEFELDRDIDFSLHDKVNTDRIGMAMIHILFNAFSHNYDPANNLPSSSKNIMNEFLSNNDPLYDFLNSNMIDINRDNKNFRININTLYSIYREFITQEYLESVKPLPVRKFTELITAKGFNRIRINYTYIIGIQCKGAEPNSIENTNTNEDNNDNDNNYSKKEITIGKEKDYELDM